MHMQITVSDVQNARASHPGALLLVHPECRKEVTEQADFAGSTTAILNYVEKSDARSFIIGTDNSIVQHLQFSHPDKEFFPLSKNCICKDMRLTTLMDVYNCVKGTGGEEILLPEDIRKQAQRSIDAMLS